MVCTIVQILCLYHDDAAVIGSVKS